jgi:hypothetical protein
MSLLVVKIQMYTLHKDWSRWLGSIQNHECVSRTLGSKLLPFCLDEGKVSFVAAEFFLEGCKLTTTFKLSY